MKSSVSSLFILVTLILLSLFILNSYQTETYRGHVGGGGYGHVAHAEWGSVGYPSGWGGWGYPCACVGVGCGYGCEQEMLSTLPSPSPL